MSRIPRLPRSVVVTGRRAAPGVILLLGLSVAPRQDAYWSDHADQLPVLREQTVSALAVVGTTLYVAAGENLLTVGLDDHAVTDVTQRIRKQPGDEITEILVDAEQGALWIALNGNTHSATCYGYDLRAMECDSVFLEDLMRRYEDMGRNAPQPSISAMALDARQAVVGFFKGNVYLYSAQSKQYRLVYTPTSAYSWAVGVALTDQAGFVATPGDGLIVIDRATGTARRFPDRAGNPIRAVAVSGAALYIGARGLYKAPVAAFLGRSSPAGRLGCSLGRRP